MTKLHEISMWTPQGLELAPSRPPSRPSSRPSSGCSEEVHQNHLHLLPQTPWSGSPALVRCLASLKHGSVMVTFTFLLNCDQECIFVLQFVLLQQKPVSCPLKAAKPCPHGATNQSESQFVAPINHCVRFCDEGLSGSDVQWWSS